MSKDCVLFDFATKNLHLATIFCHLVDKCDLRILLISSPVYEIIIVNMALCALSAICHLISNTHSRNTGVIVKYDIQLSNHMLYIHVCCILCWPLYNFVNFLLHGIK